MYGRTATIDTTSDHLFWVPNSPGGRWVKTGALRYGVHLRTPSGGTATVLSGWAPKDATGWMWDLTIPGDHDFYIDTVIASVLVHNCQPFRAAAGFTLSGIPRRVRLGTCD
jgi:hypothetical protein